MWDEFLTQCIWVLGFDNKIANVKWSKNEWTEFQHSHWRITRMAVRRSALWIETKQLAVLNDQGLVDAKHATDRYTGCFYFLDTYPNGQQQ